MRRFGVAFAALALAFVGCTDDDSSDEASSSTGSDGDSGGSADGSSSDGDGQSADSGDGGEDDLGDPSGRDGGDDAEDGTSDDGGSSGGDGSSDGASGDGSATGGDGNGDSSGDGGGDSGGSSSGTQPTAPPTVPVTVEPPPEGIVVGDCVDDPETNPVEVSCTGPHDAEVYHGFDLVGGTEYPGDDNVDNDAGEVCIGAAFDDFVGTDYDESDLWVDLYAPDAEAWADGERAVLCYLYDGNTGQPLVGTAEGSGR